MNTPPISLEETARRLKTNAAAIKQLAGAVPDHQVRVRPSEAEWSVLEQINHLYDEEMFDFRVRLKFILSGEQGTPPPPIDPQNWVIERNYNERDPAQSIENFLMERSKSLKWLSELDEVNLDLYHKLPFGELKAGDVLYSWVMHDLLHLRQMAETAALCHAEDAKPYSVEYAG